MPVALPGKAPRDGLVAAQVRASRHSLSLPLDCLLLLQDWCLLSIKFRFPTVISLDVDSQAAYRASTIVQPSTMLSILLSVFLAVVIHSTTAWVHPGILHNTADLNRMQSLVAAKTDPWYTAYNSFAADSHSSATYALEGPLEYVCRDKDDSLIYGMQQFADDSDAALQTALMWTITGEESYAEMSVKILDGWGSMLKVVNGISHNMGTA